MVFAGSLALLLLLVSCFMLRVVTLNDGGVCCVSPSRLWLGVLEAILEAANGRSQQPTAVPVFILLIC